VFDILIYVIRVGRIHLPTELKMWTVAQTSRGRNLTMVKEAPPDNTR